MRLQGMVMLLTLWAASRLVEASNPINLFRPDTGQRTTFQVRPATGSGILDTVDYWITARSGDTAYCQYLYFKTRHSAEETLVWSQGKLAVRPILRSGTFDTNGIYSRRKEFPADFTRRIGTSPAPSGYTLQHVVDGFLFDTLLVACLYNAHVDEGDNCDFVTPSGFLVFSSVEGAMFSPSSIRMIPDAETLAAMGGKPVSSPAMRKTRRMAVSVFRPMQGFDVLGRWMKAAPADAFPAAPER